MRRKRNFNNNNHIEQNKREKLLGIVENKPLAQLCCFLWRIAESLNTPNKNCKQLIRLFFVNISKNKCQHFIRLSVIPFLFKNKCPHLVENVAKKSVLLGMSFYRTSTFLILWMSLVIWAISLRCLSITSFKSCHPQTFSTVKILMT